MGKNSWIYKAFLRFASTVKKIIQFNIKISRAIFVQKYKRQTLIKIVSVIHFFIHLKKKTC